MDQDNRDKILRDQVEWFVSQSALGISATAFNSVLLSFLLVRAVSPGRVFTWLSVMLLICLVRVGVLLYDRRKGRRTDARQQKKVYLLLLSASGCAWGGAAVFLFPPDALAYQILIVFVLGGMVAGSVGVFASLLSAFSMFTVPTLLPLTLVVFSIPDRVHFVMGCMLLLFAYFMFVAAKRLNRDIHRFLVLKYENLGLIDHLEKEIRDREDAEQRLLKKHQQIESIVAVRTGALREANVQLVKEAEERIEAEAALRESETRFRELSDSLPQIVFELDLEWRMTFANRNARTLLGYSEEDFASRGPVFFLVCKEDRGRAMKNFAAVLRGDAIEGEEYTVVTREGRTLPVSVHSAPIVKGGMIIGARGIMIDLTEQKRVEAEQLKLTAQLQRAQKMEVLGTVAGGVAHDLNNILSGIFSYPDLLLLDLPSDSPLRAPIEAIQRSGKKAAAVVQDLLTLTRRGVVVEEPVDLNDIVRAYLASPEHQKMMLFHPAVAVVPLLADPLPLIAGSEVHLVKAVMNLVSNAAESMPCGGVVNISTTSLYLEQPVKGYDAIRKGLYVILTVADDGIGIAPEDIDRIFEPFYTRKVMGRSGTGLGMAVVWGTVKDHRGYVDVVSTEKKGTRISLYFPVTDKQKTARLIPDQRAAIEALRGDGETVLLVDDVEEQRQIGRQLLERLGYKAVVVASGEAAVDYLKNEQVDLVILDMIMDPGMDGLDTLKQILKQRPGQRAVITSGFSETGRLKEAMTLGAAPYLKKPYACEALGQAVKTALGKPL